MNSVVYFHSASLPREVDGSEYRRLHQQLTVKLSMKMLFELKYVVKHNMVTSMMTIFSPQIQAVSLLGW